MRTLPAYSFESDLWFKTLRQLEYNKVIFIYTNDAEGEAALNRFRNVILTTETEYGERSLEVHTCICSDLILYAMMLLRSPE